MIRAKRYVRGTVIFLLLLFSQRIEMRFKMKIKQRYTLAAYLRMQPGSIDYVLMNTRM